MAVLQGESLQATVPSFLATTSSSGATSQNHTVGQEHAGAACIGEEQVT